MKKNQGFTLKTLEGVSYLLPFGQNIADHKRGIQLNETGVFLWNAMEDCEDEASLLQALEAYYDTPISARKEMEEDLHLFLNQLKVLGIIDGGDLPEEPVMQTLKIGGLTIRLCGPKEGFSREFSPFSIQEPSFTDLTIQVHACVPSQKSNGTLLLRDRELLVCKRESDYLLLFPSSPRILEGNISLDGKNAHFYVTPPFDEALVFDLFHGIRLAFLYLAQKKGMFAIHSASILYQGKAWLFAGHSGMGKSTHTGLWKKFLGTPVLNGDLNLMELTSQGPVIHGIPWCGTSQISDRQTYPLGGIILLGRSDKDICEELSPDQKALLVAQRMISPAWTKEQLSANLEFASRLSSILPICRLRCTPQFSAVAAIKDWMDQQL